MRSFCPMLSLQTLLLCLLLCLLVSACSLTPPLPKSNQQLPDSWSFPQDQVPNAALPMERDWWKRFRDPVLDALMQEALQANRDLAVAAASVESARAQLGLARAALFPQISGSAQSTPLWVDGKRVHSGSSGSASAGFSASWELDLWGRLRSAQESARASLLASEAARDGVRLSLTGQVATGYFLLRSLDAQEAIASRTLKTREDALTIYTARYEQGLISELDLTSAQAEAEAARSTLYRTHMSRDAAETALAVLVGRSPKAILQGSMERGTPLENLPAPPVIPEGLPSDLLLRRPDIREAEQTLVAANADVGSARAAWLPPISLTGLLGLVSPELHSLLGNPSSTWNYGGNASVPLLDFGRVQAGVDSAEASRTQALFRYEKTVQAAFQDLRNALVSQLDTERIVKSLEIMTRQYREAASLAHLRYDNGYSSYLDVLDAERSLFESELNLATARSDRLSSIASLCLALGGGWK